MPFTAEKDAEFGDAHLDVYKSEKCLVRATTKTYEKNWKLDRYKIIQESWTWPWDSTNNNTSTWRIWKIDEKTPQIRSITDNSNDWDSS